MSQPIFKIVLFRSMKEAYYHLTEDEQKKLWDKVMDGIKKNGVKIHGQYDCRWSNDRYESFFLMEYPDTQALIKEIANATEAGLFRYVESETILGIEQKEG